MVNYSVRDIPIPAWNGVAHFGDISTLGPQKVWPKSIFPTWKAEYSVCSCQFSDSLLLFVGYVIQLTQPAFNFIYLTGKCFPQQVCHCLMYQQVITCFLKLPISSMLIQIFCTYALTVKVKMTEKQVWFWYDSSKSQHSLSYKSTFERAIKLKWVMKRSKQFIASIGSLPLQLKIVCVSIMDHSNHIITKWMLRHRFEWLSLLSQMQPRSFNESKLVYLILTMAKFSLVEKASYWWSISRLCIVEHI